MSWWRWLSRGVRDSSSPADASPVKVLLGLGNPGPAYANTRHNVGWWVLDHLADVWRVEGWRKDGEALAVTARLDGEQVRLIKPLTFMNLSGQLLRPYLRRPFWSASSDLLVIVDDVALPLGNFRLRATGSAGGHNGLKSVEQHLGHQDYARLRVGIRPEDERRLGNDLSDFVLSPFGKEEKENIVALLPRLSDAIDCWRREGIMKAMTNYNSL